MPGKIDPRTWLRLSVAWFLLAAVLGSPVRALLAGHASGRDIRAAIDRCLECIRLNPGVNRAPSEKALVKVNEEDDDDDDPDADTGFRELVTQIVSTQDTFAFAALSHAVRHYPQAVHPLRC
jgi:hypothetical protein